MSDLLNSASLVMIPSGYAEDKVYSAVPTDGSGDLSFTRSSNGTRINSAGLVEVTPWNLQTYSEDFTNGKYILNQASISSNATTAPNGTATADKLVENTANDQHFVYFTAQQTAYNETRISVYAKAGGRTNLLMWESAITNAQCLFNLSTGVVTSSSSGNAANLSTTVGQIEDAGNGWFRCSFNYSTSSGGGTIRLQLYTTTTSYTGDGTSGIFIWGLQENIGSTAKPYFPTTDSLNVPRLTYQNGGGGCPSLLLEKQSTNLVVQSNDMTQWVNGAGTMTKNATTSPDGTNNALSFDNSGDCSTFASASNGGYSWSLFVKQGTSATASIDMSDGATGDVITTFTFSTKTFSGTTAGGSWTSPSTSYIDLGNGWYRITLTATKNAGSSIGHKIIASGSGYTYVYGAQLEASSYPTSYIPTTSASATRVADACYKTGISSLIGQTEGTMFVDVDLTHSSTGTNAYLMQLYKEGATRILIYRDGASGGLAYYFIQSSTVFNYTSSISSNGRHKLAFGYKSGDSVFYIDGAQVDTDATTFSAFSSLSELHIGANFNPTQVEIGDYNYNESIIFPTRLTNAELASLTTI